MSVRRGTVRGFHAGILLAGLVVAGLAVDAVSAPPALAAEDSVRLRLSSSFRAGGSPGSARLTIAKRTEGCVSPRAALGIALPGLTPDQVTVETAVDGGQWRRVTVSSGGAGLVMTQRIRPSERPSICKGKSTTIRYRLTFGDAAPNGTVVVVAEAYAGGDTVIGRASGSAKVRGGRSVAAVTLPAVAPTTALPTPQAVEETTESPEVDVVAVAPSQAGAGQPAVADSGGGGLGLGRVMLLLGVGMVGIGVALLVLLIRRARGERSGRNSPAAPGGLYGSRVAPARSGADVEPTAYLSSSRPARASGQPIQPGAPGRTGPATPGVYTSAGRRVEPTMILSSSVPPQTPTEPAQATQPIHPARPTQPIYPVTPRNPEPTQVLPPERPTRPPHPDRP